VSGRSRAESQVGVRLMGVWRVSYSNIQEFLLRERACACARPNSNANVQPGARRAPARNLRAAQSAGQEHKSTRSRTKQEGNK
jgi:hypothetical protein